MFITRLFRFAYRRLRARWLIHMDCPDTCELQHPLSTYSVDEGTPFGTRCTYDGTDWGILLGDDCARPFGTQVSVAGDGCVVYARLHAPRADQPRAWGNVVIIAHRNPDTNRIFFSVYGSLHHFRVAVGDTVRQGQPLGLVAKAGTPENGGWDHAGLFFGIYTGPWKGNVIPGYYREDQGLTRPEWWHEPRGFIEMYRK